MSSRWGTDRTATAAWKRIRRDALERDGHRCVKCGWDQGPFEVDHIQTTAEGGTDTLDNAQTLCTHCHQQKTAAEAARGRARRAARGRHPTEKHPGLR